MISSSFDAGWKGQVPRNVTRNDTNLWWIEVASSLMILFFESFVSNEPNAGIAVVSDISNVREDLIREYLLKSWFILRLEAISGDRTQGK